MMTKKFYFWLAFVVFAASACDSSSSNKEEADSGTTNKHPKVSDASTDGDSSEDLADGEVDAGKQLGLSNLCGNGKVEGVEECDDGDFDERNGCTALCKFSCSDDSDCDDGNDCNGKETCGTDDNEHACNDDDAALDDGDPCGESGADKSCLGGVCVANVCGDKKTTGSEECDDGNLDPDDGCTPDCEYTCNTDEDCSGSDACLGDRTCDHHECVGGSKLDDQTACAITDKNIKSACGDTSITKDGWCMGGKCTCTDCGDGEIDGHEKCDDGVLNGTDDSPNHCSINCQVVACGNGSVEGDEECDDGNESPLDGCDANCKYEFAHRLTSMKILKMTTAPEWCAHSGDRFSEAFATNLQIFGAMSFDVLNMVNDSLTSESASGNNNFILQILDSSDTTMRTVDDEITIGAYQGNPYNFNKDTIQNLDIPFIIQADQVDPDTREPAEYHSIPASQSGGIVKSTEPVTLEMQGIGGAFKMYDYMVQLVFDIKHLSKPKIVSTTKRDTLKISDNLKLPEYSGRDPQGLLCGAMDQNATNRPIIQGSVGGMGSSGNFGPIATMCCKNRSGSTHNNQKGAGGGKYRPCGEGQTPPNDCDSISQLIHDGCTVCLNMSDMTGIMASVTGDSGSDCTLMDSAPSNCFQIINGIDFDVSSSGEGGELDTWSVVFGFDAMRVRLYDVAVE
jgi:cysteine-rich repeat protein